MYLSIGLWAARISGKSTGDKGACVSVENVICLGEKPHFWEVNRVNMQENARLILGLRSAGWSEKKINDFILFIESGEEQYKPTMEKD